jgi:hypothetical protein
VSEALEACNFVFAIPEKLFDFPGLSTIYLYWWAPKPREIAERFRAKLQSVLLEANRR